jgi:hypothetical protein
MSGEGWGGGDGAASPPSPISLPPPVGLSSGLA